ncbi:MAG TPA: hypothetical protein VGH15_08295, partial [Caulobacteraceae bacterium]
MTTKILSGVYGATYNLAPPVTTLSITPTGYLEAGIVSKGLAAYTIVNAGFVYGEYDAISLAGAGTVTNSGTFRTDSTVSGAGIMLGDGGSLTNAKGARIQAAYNGVVIAVAAGTVDNQGSLVGAASYAIDLAGGGLVVNGGTVDTGAFIRGNKSAVDAILSATVHNYGSILSTGTMSSGVTLRAGGLVTNGSAGNTVAAIEGYHFGMAAGGGASTVNNFGTIRGDDGGGVVLGGGGIVTNGGSVDTTALIEGAQFGIGATTIAATVINFGTVIGGYDASGLDIAVDLNMGGVVTNGSTADVSARLGAAVGVVVTGAVSTVNNFGTIGGLASAFGVAVQAGGRITNGSAGDTTALIQGSVGAAGQAVAATVVNFGSIIGDLAGGPFPLSYRDAVLLQAGGVATNGSSIDTIALMQGYIGVAAQTIASTVTNFGAIVGTYAGVSLAAGGRVVNGSASDTTARISGARGVYVANGLVANFATIIGGVAQQFGVGLAHGTLTNGGGGDHTALIHGYKALYATYGQITNNATISGGTAPGSLGAGVALVMGCNLVNNAGALIRGFYGLTAGATCTVSNFGTIESLQANLIAVRFSDSTDRMNLEAGSSVIGTLTAATGLLDVVSGVANVSAVFTAGKIIGAGALSLGAGDTFFEPGTSLAVAKIEVAAATTVTVATKLADSKIWDQIGGDLLIQAGEQIAFSGTGNTFSGTVSGAGSVLFSGGSDAFSNLTLSAGKMSINKSTVTFSGAIDLTGALSVASPALIVA